jgi:hypothetical protein
MNGLEVFNLNWSLQLLPELLSTLCFRVFCSDVRISGFESSANFVEEQEQGVFQNSS